MVQEFRDGGGVGEVDLFDRGIGAPRRLVGQDVDQDPGGDGVVAEDVPLQLALVLGELALYCFLIC